jgi:hypothetical protein
LAAQIEQLFSLVAQLRLDFVVLSAEFQDYRSRTDAEHTAATVEDCRPPGDWLCVGEIAFLTNRCSSTIHKWVRLKKIRFYQPGGPRTAIWIDAENLPAGVHRSAQTAVDTPRSGRS